MIGVALLFLIKFTVAISLLALFYKLVLSKLTFFNSIRIYFLVGTLVAFGTSMINIPAPTTQSIVPSAAWLHYIPSVTKVTHQYIKTQPLHKAIDPMMIFIAVWIVGILFFIARISMQCFSLYRMKQKSTAVSNGSIQIYHISDKATPFSFGNGIYLYPDGLSATDYRHIIRHEEIHIRQKHSLDMLIGELVCILNWYNPFAWMLKKSIRQNLEYLTDNIMVHQGADPKVYQYILLKALGHDHFRFTPTFNAYSLKSRITMMNSSKSLPFQKLKFLLVIPVVVFMMMAFRSVASDPTSYEQFKDLVTSSLPAAVVSGLTIASPVGSDPGHHNSPVHFSDDHTSAATLKLDTTPPKNTTPHGIQQGTHEYSMTRSFEVNDEVQKIVMKGKTNSDNVATVYLRNGKKEIYDLNNDKSKVEFEEKYGDRLDMSMSIPPVPPIPPMAPIAPIPPSPTISHAPPAPTAPTPPIAPMGLIPPVAPVAPIAPLPPTAPVPDWVHDLPADVTEISHSNDVLNIKFKDGTSETYDFNDPSQKKKFKEKYKDGKIKSKNSNKNND